LVSWLPFALLLFSSLFFSCIIFLYVDLFIFHIFIFSCLQNQSPLYNVGCFRTMFHRTARYIKWSRDLLMGMSVGKPRGVYVLWGWMWEMGCVAVCDNGWGSVAGSAGSSPSKWSEVWVFLYYFVPFWFPGWYLLYFCCLFFSSHASYFDMFVFSSFQLFIFSYFHVFLFSKFIAPLECGLLQDDVS
jgi:hypothetical protein